MTSDFDPQLQNLFTQAEQEFDCEAFMEGLMTRINHDRRRTLTIWITIGAAVVACLAFLAAPLIATVTLVSDLLPMELVEFEAEWLQLLISPVNSVAAAIAVGVLALRSFYRRIFR